MRKIANAYGPNGPGVHILGSPTAASGAPTRTGGGWEPEPDCTYAVVADHNREYDSDLAVQVGEEVVIVDVFPTGMCLVQVVGDPARTGEIPADVLDRTPL